MFNLATFQSLAAIPKAAPARTGRTVEPPRPSQPGRPHVAALISTPAGHRRWTVVIPRRLTERAAEADAQAEAFHAAQPAPRPPIRFAAQATMFGLIAAVGSGLYVYSAKHAAATLDRQITRAFLATGTAHQQTSLLRAEWALLNNPDRLHPLAERYLSLTPMAAAQFVQIAELHNHLPKIMDGPPPPDSVEDDAATPPVAGKRLLAMAAMATVPAGPDTAAEPDQAAPSASPVLATAPASADTAPSAPELAKPARAMATDTVDAAVAEAPPPEAAPPVVAAPSSAYRVLAHAGIMPKLVYAEPSAVPSNPDEAQSGLMESAPAKLPTVARPVRSPWTPMQTAHVPTRLAPAPLPQPASKLLARAEPHPHVVRPPTMLRPELVHELMMPRPSYASTLPPRPKVSFALATPQRHLGIARSEQPHDLLLPSSEPAETPRPDYEGREQAYNSAPSYRPPAPFPYRPPVQYRPPYWAYNVNPYGGMNPYAGGPYVPAYPGYQ